MIKSREYSKSKRIALIGCISASLLTSCGSGKGTVPGMHSFHIGVLKGTLVASFVSETLKWDEGISVPIPGLKDANISIAPDISGKGSVIQFSTDLHSLLDHQGDNPLSGLPDGRPIPDISGGLLPRWDVKIRNLKLSLYLSQDAFGLYIPIGFFGKNGAILKKTVSTVLKDERGNLLGKVFAIPQNVSGDSSGLLILLPYLGGSQQVKGSSN